MELTLTIDSHGVITRDEDGKHLATVNALGEIEFTNSAYKRGQYLKSIEALAAPYTGEGSNPPPVATEESDDASEPPQVELADPRIPTSEPERDPNLGAFSAEFINWDHANLTDEDFAKKYQHSAASKLEFIARRPARFADRDALEARLAKLLP